MASAQAIMDRVRRELGDRAEPFNATVAGDGSMTVIDLPRHNVIPQALVITEVNSVTSTVKSFVINTDYTLDADNGQIVLTVPLSSTAILAISGQAYSLFSDTDIGQYINDALNQHTSARSVQQRYVDGNGFVQYIETPLTLTNLDPVEEVPLAILAAIQAFWTLLTDAATDTNIQSAEGTFVDRAQRYHQMTEQIDRLTNRYKDLCQQLNVGLYRIEISNLRRVSRTTNRLVPVYKEREYDDNKPYPQRILPPIDDRDEDTSGAPEQGYWGWW